MWNVHQRLNKYHSVLNSLLTARSYPVSYQLIECHLFYKDIVSSVNYPFWHNNKSITSTPRIKYVTTSNLLSHKHLLPTGMISDHLLLIKNKVSGPFNSQCPSSPYIWYVNNSDSGCNSLSPVYPVITHAKAWNTSSALDLFFYPPTYHEIFTKISW